MNPLKRIWILDLISQGLRPQAVVIFEVPGGDPEHARLLQGPHLVGTGADLAPVLLTFSGDAKHPDLVVTVNGLQVLFHNTGTSYAPMR